jgi:hypothetical protein
MLVAVAQAPDGAWMESGEMSNQQQPPEPNFPGPEAHVVGRDGQPVLDENGNPKTMPVTPSGLAELPPGSERQRVIGPDGSVGEHITIKPR